MTETLHWAAAEIDQRGTEVPWAVKLPSPPDKSCTRGLSAILALATAAGGARPVCLDGPQSRRSADLYVYLAQHHGGRDAAALARHALDFEGPSE